MSLIKLIASAITCFLFLSCNAQDNIKNFIPPYYKETQIRKDYSAYKKTAVDLTKYLPINYSKQGNKDYTSYLQKGISENEVVIMPNFPTLINDIGLKVKNNSVLLFNENSALMLAPSRLGTYNMIEVHHVKNVKIFFAKLQGDMQTHLRNEGEWGMGIGIRSSNNISIYNPTITDCWGDGIYVGYVLDTITKTLYNESKNINIYNAFVNNSGRNGLSIVAVDSINVYNSFFANARRTFPKSGIDIEPGAKPTKNILLQNNVTYKNGAKGIDIFLRKLANLKDPVTKIEIVNHKDVGSPIGIRVGKYIAKQNSKIIQGTVLIQNPTFLNNRLKEIDIEDNQQFAPNFRIKLKNNKKLLLLLAKLNNSKFMVD